MYLPPYVVRPDFGLWYWVLLSSDGKACVQQSSCGFQTEEEAKADFAWHYSR